MPESAKTQIFLERRSYRQRRMMDALRLLPFLGLALWFLPTLWVHTPGETSGAVPMSRALIYIFGVWVFLILACAGLWLRLRAMDKNTNDKGHLRGDGKT